jgi:hypothetical protein
MKRDDLNAEKQKIRAEILLMQSNLRSMLLEKGAIPRSIVDAPLSVIQDFKKNCEKASKIYHATKAPGKHKTVDQLIKIRERIREISFRLAR